MAGAGSKVTTDVREVFSSGSGGGATTGVGVMVSALALRAAWENT